MLNRISGEKAFFILHFTFTSQEASQTIATMVNYLTKSGDDKISRFHLIVFNHGDHSA